MQHHLSKVLCLSGTILFAQQLLASQSSAVDDDLDLASVAREAERSFEEEKAKGNLKRYKQYRLSKSLSIDTSVKSPANPASQSQQLKTMPPIITIDPSPVIEWFHFCRTLYAVEQQPYAFWYENMHVESAKS